MGCSNCASGTPAGCKNNGNCGVSGCNKLEVFDWLAGMELPLGQTPFDVIEVRFKNSRKGYYRTSADLELQVGDVVCVNADPGTDVGIVSLAGELVRIQLQRRNVKDNHELKKVRRKATEEDIALWQEARKEEWDTMLKARSLARELGLEMKISDVEYQGDKAKATFYYTAEGRVDFRELIRKMAEAFKVRIEMRQIGMRQEASRLGGIGSCGRELCCSTWLTDFRSVSTSAARYQQLALNPTKLAGQCGKLKCCLNYELDQYLESVKEFPSANTKLKTGKGRAFHFKTDIFKRVMYFIYEDQVGTSPIPLDVDRVKEILEMNKNGEFPDGLEDFQETLLTVEEPDYANVVGQDDLTRFDNKKSGRGRGRGKGRGKGGNRNSGGGGNQRGRKPSNRGNKPQAKGPGEGQGSSSGNKPRGKGGQNPKSEGSNNKRRSGNRNRGRGRGQGGNSGGGSNPPSAKS